MKTYQHFIGGQYVDPLGGKWIDSMDPYRGEAWAKIPQGSAADEVLVGLHAFLRAPRVMVATIQRGRTAAVAGRTSVK